MPKKNDAPEVCDGCGMERDDVADEPNAAGHRLCPACADRRQDDPSIRVHGREMLYSEFEAQAEDDIHLAAAKDGDTVQEQLKAARLEARDR
jgi:hypothetical protein